MVDFAIVSYRYILTLTYVLFYIIVCTSSINTPPISISYPKFLTRYGDTHAIDLKFKLNEKRGGYKYYLSRPVEYFVRIPIKKADKSYQRKTSVNDLDEYDHHLAAIDSYRREGGSEYPLTKAEMDNLLENSKYDKRNEDSRHESAHRGSRLSSLYSNEVTSPKFSDRMINSEAIEVRPTYGFQNELDSFVLPQYLGGQAPITVQVGQYSPLTPYVFPSGNGISVINPTKPSHHPRPGITDAVLSRLRSFSTFIPNLIYDWARSDATHSRVYNLPKLPSPSNHLNTTKQFKHKPEDIGTVSISRDADFSASERYSTKESKKRVPSTRYPSENEIKSFNPKFSSSLSTGRGRCDLRNGQVFHGDRCRMLLSQGSCLDHHWLVLLDSGLPVCAHKKCPTGKLFYKGRCVNPYSNNICSKGQILYVDLFGNSECDCDEDRIYDSLSGECFAEGGKGFCPEAHHIQLSEEGTPSCVPNPCYEESLIKVDGRCYRKVFTSFCHESQIVFDKEHGIAECEYVRPKSVFGVGIQSVCPYGSRRRYLNRCNSIFRLPTQKTFPKQRGSCPPNFFNSEDICRRTVDLFG